MEADAEPAGPAPSTSLGLLYAQLPLTELIHAGSWVFPKVSLPRPLVAQQPTGFPSHFRDRPLPEMGPQRLPPPVLVEQ